ncbi:MAG TPA: 3-methyl-2-oxobutanoate hydroxymethyltransferase [Synergistales bacterium]|nr:3-methyl-2-oxobutanoate hydroxymethyltransferase [Synergistales bacterium]NLV65046.1 3-methyl-2-oxobutanoate hydroxymethyltransferase [Synergistaceae bacterium]HRV71151.1 3-methyl-2-oxobutanoate hydroxymethyltransferase [Thermovirgaceae bacterium]MDD3133987.1 3-methyl-2-oxobutanoate hydroxymethyltransferase [Synergistales bacterium]MDD3830596.1 3-methyl-2-oxobutanoate hydroxymethyltransferase [Synergistales bacterium]
MAKVTIQQLQKMKEDGEKISMVTAYDFSQAVLVEKAEIEVILVGDSLAMTTLGHEGTTALTTDEMIAHIRPVVKGAPSPMVIGDLVFGSYNESIAQAIHSSNRLIKEGGCDAVKLEGALPDTVRAIVDAGIAVQGHLGLTPQTAVLLGGFKVQGKGHDAALKLLDDARRLEEAGVFSIVLECVPEELGRVMSQIVSVPVIGIGAGRFCDGQVLVFHDMLGLFDRFTPRFVKQYRQIGQEIVGAFQEFKEEIRNGSFPSEEHAFSGFSREEADGILAGIKSRMN